MKTDEEIKKEFEERFITKHFSENGFYFNSDSIGYFDEVQTQPSVVMDWWLSKFHTLQEEYEEKLHLMKITTQSCGDQNLMAYKVGLIIEIQKLMLEFADTPLDKRQSGWDWLIKARNIIKQ